MNEKTQKMIAGWIEESKGFGVVSDAAWEKPLLLKDSPEEFEKAIIDLAGELKLEKIRLPLFLFLKTIEYLEERFDSLSEKLGAH